MHVSFFASAVETSSRGEMRLDLPLESVWYSCSSWIVSVMIIAILSKITHSRHQLRKYRVSAGRAAYSKSHSCSMTDWKQLFCGPSLLFAMTCIMYSVELFSHCVTVA